MVPSKQIQQLTCIFNIRVNVSGKCQGNLNFLFSQGQGFVREFCDVSGKNEILQKCQGNVREFYISA